MSKLSLKKKTLIIVSVLILAALIPIVPMLSAMFVAYFLLLAIPIALGTLVLIVSFFATPPERRKQSVVAVLLGPAFFLTMLSSGYIADLIQRKKAEKAVVKIEKIKAETGTYPDTMKLGNRLSYSITEGGEYLLISHCSFLLVEEYSSATRSWKKYGWND